MANQKRITYGIDLDSGQTFSQFGGEVAWPTLAFCDMDPGLPGFSTSLLPYKLEKRPVFEVLRHARVRRTRKVDQKDKNDHRAFWGMKPLA